MIDIILLVVGVAAVLAGLAALGKGPISADELPSFMPIIVAVGGAGALVLMYYRLFVDPVPGFGSALGGAGTVDISVGRGPGRLLAACAAIAILVASASVADRSAHPHLLDRLSARPPGYRRPP